MIDANDARFMAQAIRLAEKGQYSTHPNPCVGSVFVKDGRVIGTGYHQQAGHGHAEANALRTITEDPAGATVYCTLEPCSFHGRTPSCASALVKAGVARVVSAMEDPHPKNRGQGHDILRAAGIAVDCGLMESSARALNPGHFKRFESGLPYVRLKLAMSTDGKTALANGKSQWITSAAARRDVQKWRARSGAIVTGVQTVIDDDPLMTVRADELDVEHAELAASITRPVVVLDSTARIPRHAKVLQAASTLIVSHRAAADLTPRQILVDDDGNGRLSPEAVLRALVSRDVNDVLIECGATLAAAFIAAGLVDELIVYVAPLLLGADARSLLNLAKIDSMQHRIELQLMDTRQVGDDVRLIFHSKDQ